LHVLDDETRLGATMHDALAADVATAPEIAFVHRKLPFADIYFLVNTSNHEVHHHAVFRIQGLDAAWWDPFTGKVSRTDDRPSSSVKLDLAPYESRVLVFSKDRVTEPTPSAASETTVMDLSADWKVTFPGNEPVEMPKLVSWTALPGRLYYSGLTNYEKTVEVPKVPAGPLYLNFGQGTPVTEGRRGGSGMRAMMESPVREAAVVFVNGLKAGSVWCAPYEVNVSGLLRAGFKNTIMVQVANLAINNMAKGPLPDYKELNAKYGERFQAQDMNAVLPQASGLLGGVRLVTR
jgi:hypothetical protein